MAKMMPLKRIGRPEDMAGPAIFLSSKAGVVPHRHRHPRRRRHRHDEVAAPCRSSRRRARGGSPIRDVADEHGVVGVGADLEPGTLLQAYRQRPLPDAARHAAARWGGGRRTRGASSRSTGCVVSRSLRRSCGRYEVRVDTAFADGDRRVRRPRPSRRLDHRRRSGDAYVRAARARVGPQRRGVGRRRARRRAVRRRDRRAVRRRVDVPPPRRRVEGRARSRSSTCCAPTCAARLLDVQWPTDHLASLGVVVRAAPSVPRAPARPRSSSRRPRGGRELSSRTGGRRGRWTPARSCPRGRCPRRPATPGRSRGRRRRRAARSSAGSRPTASRSTR